MSPNTTGLCPDEARGKRVKVKLRNGSTFEGHADEVRRGDKINWHLTGSDFDIMEYEVI